MLVWSYKFDTVRVLIDHMMISVVQNVHAVLCTWLHADADSAAVLLYSVGGPVFVLQ